MDLKELSKELQAVKEGYFEFRDVERTGKFTRLNEHVNKLIACREHLDNYINLKLELAIKDLKHTLEDADIDEVTLDNFKPEDSKCIYSQEVLKAVRKELKETRELLSSCSSDLVFLTDEVESLFYKVNNGCID